jgi:short-subunit dehydrogenase
MLNIVITGSARGIGLEMAKEFLRKGCNVTLSSVNLQSLSKAEGSLEQFKNQLIAVPCDVRDREALRNLWNASKQKWGSVDIWINNAGVSQPSNKMLWELSDSITDGLVETNICGVIYGSQVAAAEMLRQGSGFIYNMEGLGSDGRIIKGTSLYGMSKWNLTYFTKALARELEGTPVKAGRLLPGMMVTDFITKPSIGEEERVVEDRTKRIFNILGDRPETVARFLVERMLANQKNNAHIAWLTNRKVIGRFVLAAFQKRELFTV